MSNATTLFGRQPHSQRALRAVDPRVHHGVELELHPQLFDRKPLHLPDLVPVERDGDGLQLERQPPLQQGVNAAHALVIRARNPGEPLVGLFGPPIERDLDRKRPPPEQVVSDLGGDERAVREQRDEKPLFLGVRVDVEKLPPRQDFSARVEQPEAAGVREFVEHATVLVVAQLFRLCRLVSHRKVVVAVRARQRAAPRQFKGSAQGHPIGDRLLMQRLTERTVPDGFDFHVLRLVSRAGPDQTPRFQRVKEPEDVSYRLLRGHVIFPAKLIASTMRLTGVAPWMSSQTLEPTSFKV